MKCARIKEVPMGVRESAPNAKGFFGLEMMHDLGFFRPCCGIIFANR